MSSGLETAVEDGVLVLTLNRPGTGNALRAAEMAAIADAVTPAPDDPAIRAVLLRAKGRHFCAGADLVSANSGAAGAAGRPGGGAPGDGGSSRENGQAVDGRAKPRIGHMLRGLRGNAHRMIHALWECPLPVVVAVQGRAAGIGLHLVLTADVAVAARSATFSEPFSRLGFSADSGGTFLLPRIVGVTRAKQMLLRGLVVEAGRALDWGLVAEVVDDGDLDKAARDVAVELAGGPTFALGVTKSLLHRNLQVDLGAALENEAMAVELTLRGDDFKEGIRAFAAKRPPGFTGR